MDETATRPLLSDYDASGYYCELFGSPERPATHNAGLIERLRGMSIDELARRARTAERELFNLGITFTVYSESDAIDRILPFDVIPRVLSAADWDHLERGIVQRVTAINLFLKDIYGDQKILKDGVVPADLIFGNKNFRQQMVGVKVAHDTYVHVCGVDLVRNEAGEFLVLEDNARCPSGVSYVVENRHMMQRTFADLMSGVGIRPVGNYGQMLLEACADIAPADIQDPTVVLLSPGTYNSAYFEHIFLAREMGVPLVEGRDLLVENDRVYMRTISGLQPVHTIYRRIDDDFLDPEIFRPDSMLGVPGLMRAYRAGNLGLANAVGTGVADDKAVYAYMPRIIKYYLGEDPVLNNVETHICREPEGLRYTLDHLSQLVVKPVGESGGYGVMIGPRASLEELADTREKLLKNPANFISQPMVKLSVCPTLIEHALEPRHVDLRPFAVTSQKTWVLPGGLSRVAMKRGSLVVNSSQGGGSKDTWVLES